MKQVAKDEDADLDFIKENVAKDSIIIPKNTASKQKIKCKKISSFFTYNLIKENK